MNKSTPKVKRNIFYYNKHDNCIACQQKRLQNIHSQRIARRIFNLDQQKNRVNDQKYKLNKIRCKSQNSEKNSSLQIINTNKLIFDCNHMLQISCKKCSGSIKCYFSNKKQHKRCQTSIFNQNEQYLRSTHKKIENLQKLPTLYTKIRSSQKNHEPKFNSILIGKINQKKKNDKKSIRNRKLNHCFFIHDSLKINPLNLKTQYEIIRIRDKMLQSEYQRLQHQEFLIKLPQTEQQVSQFIKNYKTQNQKINVEQLKKKQNFGILIINSHDKKSIQSLYFGQVDKEKKNGLGIMIRSKSVFEGQWKSDFKIFGIKKTNKGVYKGTFKDNKKDGEGQFKSYNGEFYKGQWKIGLRYGTGYWKSKEGQSYYGNWINNSASGYGIYVTKHKSQYQGNFYNFKKHGAGIEKFENGDCYDGKFIQGKAHGKGQYRWKNGIIFKGQFYENKRNGKCEIIHKQDYKFQGQFRLGKAEGKCKITINNNQIFEGQFKDSKKHGYGIWKIQDSNQYFQSVWQNDQIIEIY